MTRFFKQKKKIISMYKNVWGSLFAVLILNIILVWDILMHCGTNTVSNFKNFKSRIKVNKVLPNIS